MNRILPLAFLILCLFSCTYVNKNIGVENKIIRRVIKLDKTKSILIEEEIIKPNFRNVRIKELGDEKSYIFTFEGFKPIEDIILVDLDEDASKEFFIICSSDNNDISERIHGFTFADLETSYREVHFSQEELSLHKSLSKNKLKLSFKHNKLLIQYPTLKHQENYSYTIGKEKGKYIFERCD